VSQDAQNAQQDASETSLRPAVDTSLSRPSGIRVPDGVDRKTDGNRSLDRSVSPTKLPMGSHQRSTSVKQLPTPTPSLRPTGIHYRQTSLNKTPLLKRPTDVRPGPPGTTSKSAVIEGGSAQSILPKRQLSPVRGPLAAQQPKPRGPTITTRSSSIATRNALGAQAGAVAETKARSSITPPAIGRPGFTAHQQSFSPQRPKRVPSKEVTAEDGPRLYTRESLEPTLELLHLHTMHRDSARVQQEWHESARTSYRRQFDKLKNFSLSLNDREKDAMEQTNAAAIMAWGNQDNGATIERKMQILSSVISEAYEVTENDGKYTMAVHAFEDWYDNAQAIHRRRFDKRAATTSRLDVVEGLGDGWKAEIGNLAARVLHVSNNILSLGDVQLQSELSRCVTTLSEMLMNMLEELEMMQSIEQSMVEQEQFWVQSSIDRMATDLRIALPE
jgi:hypothetical protein